MATDALFFGVGFLSALGTVASVAAVVIRRRFTRRPPTAAATIPFDFSVYRLTDED